MKTLALSMIVKDELKLVERIVGSYEDIFDKVYITVSDEPTYEKIKAWENPALAIDYRPWTDNFAEARNHNLSLITEDYVFWMDADDRLQNAEKLLDLVVRMEAEKLDFIQLKYEYARNDLDESIADHWRERLFRRTPSIKWVGAVHETLITEMPRMERSYDVVVKHHTTPERMAESAKRNFDILKADYAKNKDPRTAHYLGLSYMNQGDYDAAIAAFLEHIETSGWYEEQYRSWCRIAECELLQNKLNKAIAATNGAIGLLPAYPDAYYLKAMIYNEMGQFEKVVEWLNVALSKPEPETLSIVDPTLYKYRGLFLGALAYLQLGEIKKAWALYQEVVLRSPDYPLAKEMKDLFEQSYYDDLAIDKSRWLLHYVRAQGGNPAKVLEGLPYRLMADPRLNYERSQMLPAKIWPKKSIVFYCGPSAEEWGPDTLHKGMGGSEEAIIYLSRQLAEIGWKVTVYCDREEAVYDDSGSLVSNIAYLPWSLFNPNDTFDVIVAWRNPFFFNGLDIKARIKAIDLHDTPTGAGAITETSVKNVDYFFFKSKYHRSLASNVPDEKAIIATNGIVVSHFPPTVPPNLKPGDQYEMKDDLGGVALIKKRNANGSYEATSPDGKTAFILRSHMKIRRSPHKVIYASSADRGLDVLLDMWPKVKEAVPDAELVWAYGWDAYDQFHSDNPERMQWKWRMQQKMRQVGCKELGRLSHEDLAKEMQTCGVWAYPTSFPEISCITAMKAQAAGLACVTSGFAALQETVLLGDEREVEEIHAKPDELEYFKDRLIEALNNPLTKEDRKELTQAAFSYFNWKFIVKVWDAFLRPKQ